MKKLTSLKQLKIGTRLKIVGIYHKNSYGSVSVKRVIKCDHGTFGTWHEILINRKQNYFFHLEKYLAGKSNWVKEVFVLKGTDKRLKGAQAYDR